MSSEVTLKDFEIRYRNIKLQNPKVKKCTVSGCHNPIDTTPSLGEDTCCAYHRLLFDFWINNVLKPEWCPEPKSKRKGFHHYLKSQKGRRRAFTNWMNRTGKERLDKLVLRMAQEGINWEC